MKNKIYYIIILLSFLFTMTNGLSAEEKDGKIKQISAANYKKETSKGVVLVDFWAPWCGPCRTMNPVLEELAKEYKSEIKIAKVNTDRNQLFAQNMKIQAIPVIIVYKDGVEVTRITGAVPKEKLEQVIKQYIAND